MDLLLAFAWASLVIELTPGPNMTYLAVLTIAEGRRAGLAAVAGVAIGLATMGLLSVLGVGALVARSTMLFEALRIGGIAYLVWLAWDTWRGERDGSNGAVKSGEPIAAFRRGLITNLLNPKAALFFVSVLPNFADPVRPFAPQAAALVAIYVAVATAIHVAIVLLAMRLRTTIDRAASSAVTRQAMALALLVIAAWLAWSTRR